MIGLYQDVADMRLILAGIAHRAYYLGQLGGFSSLFFYRCSQFDDYNAAEGRLFFALNLMNWATLGGCGL